MSNKILQKRNITNTNKPTHIESDVGDLVVNTLTGRVYTQKSDGTTVELKDFNDKSVNNGKAICMKQSWNKECQESSITVNRLADIMTKCFG